MNLLRLRRPGARDGEGGEDAKGTTGKPAGTTPTASSFAQGMLERSRGMMRNVLDRSIKREDPKATGKPGEKEEDESDDEGNDRDKGRPEGDSPDKGKDKRGPGIRSTLRLQKLAERNKENVDKDAAGAPAPDGASSSTLEKITSRLKRRGLTRRSSKEEVEQKSDSDPEDQPGADTDKAPRAR
jgi:hypothetical protein